MKRDLQLAGGAAAATIAAGAVLWAAGVPSVLALLASLAVAVAAIVALGRRWYRQIMARLDAHSAHLQSTVGIAATAGDIPVYWSDHAITPQALELIRHLLETLDAQSVLELGSGVSTVLLANDFRRRGAGHIMSVDDDERWARQTEARLRREKLDHIAEVQVAPLVEVEAGGRRGKWYDLADLDAEARFDLILVDGPPAWHGDAEARRPALYKLRSRLADKGVLVLDDAARAGERAVARQWQRDFPDLHFRLLQIGRGLLVVSVQKSTLDLLPS